MTCSKQQTDNTVCLENPEAFERNSQLIFAIKMTIKIGINGVSDKGCARVFQSTVFLLIISQ